MTVPTRDQIVALLGEVDDLSIERLLATGASLDEISEALDDLEDERHFAEQAHTASSGRVLAVREILEDVLDDDVADDAAVHPVA